MTTNSKPRSALSEHDERHLKAMNDAIVAAVLDLLRYPEDRTLREAVEPIVERFGDLGGHLFA